LYAYKLRQLTELEKLSEQGYIELYYGDESHVCSDGYVPYGWQFPDEQVAIAAQKGFRLNCLALITRHNRCLWTSTKKAINADFMLNFLDHLSLKIQKDTVIVLDNATVHTAKIIRKQRTVWQKRGLYIFYLPPYSPHLNIAETLWRMLKMQWLRPEDYLDNETLAYATNRCLANVGKNLYIKFTKFNVN